ncbi:MAG: hypothetical protein NVS4B2_33650 [Chloroflexota bacterium]
MRTAPARAYHAQVAHVSLRTSRAVIWLTIAALLVSCTLLGATVAGYFRVHHVVVVGGSANAEAVARTAAITDRNIFTVRSDDVVRRLAVFKTFDVQRVDTTFPDRVTVYVHVRRRFLAWQDGPTLYEVDPQGRIVGQVRSTRLPVIQGMAAGGELEPGIVQSVRYAAETLPGAPNGAVAVFRTDPKSGLVIVGRMGWTAYAGQGTPQQLVNRIAWLRSLLADPHVRHRRIQSVDLRYTTPVLRYARP